MDLSIVIPVFEESKKIAGDIEAAAIFLESNHLEGEIIIIDDGSSDGTREAARAAGSGLSGKTGFKIIHYDNHRGKGYAVRAGVKEATGKYVMFADSGCCVPYKNILQGLKLLESGECDIAHGSRKIEGSRIRKKQGLYRRICSTVFHWLMIYVMKIPADLTDTQCGFKIYSGNVGRKLYRECITNGFMFDAEIILRAKKEGYVIKEFPIEWTCDRDSRLSPTRNLGCILSELIAIKRTLGKGNTGKQAT